MRRLSRSLVALSAAILGIVLAKDMDKFLGLLGALLGSPLAFTFPALIHLNLVAQTKVQKGIDYAIIALSIFTLVFSTSMSLRRWVKGNE